MKKRTRSIGHSVKSCFSSFNVQILLSKSMSKKCRNAYSAGCRSGDFQTSWSLWPCSRSSSPPSPSSPTSSTSSPRLSTATMRTMPSSPTPAFIISTWWTRGTFEVGRQTWGEILRSCFCWEKKNKDDFWANVLHDPLSHFIWKGKGDRCTGND